VFKLTDRGERWERISEDLSTRALEKIETVGSEAETHGTVVSLVESPLSAGMLWAGTDDGLVHVTADDGKTWANVTPSDAGGRYIAKIEASHHQRDTAYVAIDGHRMNDMNPHLLVTTDTGKTWRSIVGDLPVGAHVNVVREDVVNPNVLYVGTERAAYVSIDRGEHWIKLNNESLPTVAIDDLLQHPREMDLVAGTHGRSIYLLDDASPISQLTPEIVQSPFHLFDVRPAKPRVFLPNEGLWGDRMFTSRNPAMGARITYWIRDYSQEDVSLSIEDSHGTVMRKLQGSNRPGLNRVVWDLQMEKYDKIDNPDASLGQTAFVPPGEYTVNFSFGKAKASKTFTVLASPGDSTR
jgi:hypothetical protein